MNNVQFDQVLSKRLATIQNVLGQKAAEYSYGGDRLSQFKRAAEIQHISTAQACLNFFMKHLVSVQDMVESKRSYSEEQWNEKLGDMINYLILLEAIVTEPEPGALTREEVRGLAPGQPLRATSDSQGR